MSDLEFEASGSDYSEDEDVAESMESDEFLSRNTRPDTLAGSMGSMGSADDALDTFETSVRKAPQRLQRPLLSLAGRG